MFPQFTGDGSHQGGAPVTRKAQGMNRTRPHPLTTAARAVAVVAGIAMGVVAALAAVPASAATVCDVGSDQCVVGAQTAQTPLGPVTVTVTDAGVVTVQLAPTAPGTLVVGIPFTFPPGPPARPGWVRTTIDTTGGVINVDTFMWPPGPPTRLTLPNLAVISIHPPGPCRVSTSLTTVTFAPIFPPGPPT